MASNDTLNDIGRRIEELSMSENHHVSGTRDELMTIASPAAAAPLVLTAFPRELDKLPTAAHFGSGGGLGQVTSVEWARTLCPCALCTLAAR